MLPLSGLFIRLLEELVQTRHGLRPADAPDATLLERWEDEAFIYLEVDLPGEPGPDIDICIREGRVFIRMERPPARSACRRRESPGRGPAPLPAGSRRASRASRPRPGAESIAVGIEAINAEIRGRKKVTLAPDATLLERWECGGSPPQDYAGRDPQPGREQSPLSRTDHGRGGC
jgi:hypothetical protein